MNADYPNAQHTDEIAAFLAVAGQGSFVAAGRLLGRHSTVISKRLAAMEKRLGVTLIERSTRQLRITDVGLNLAQHLRAATSMIVEAQQQAAQSASQARGTLKLALPAAMGRQWLAPMLPEFLEQYPHVSVVADYSERVVDIIDEGFDAAIRIGELEDNRLIAKKLCNHRRILCASPAYLARYGVPKTPQDLVHHQCLRFSGLDSFPYWHLHCANQRQVVQPRGNMTSNDNEALLASACAGAGIIGAGEWLMTREIAAGRLVRILECWQLDATGGVYLVRPSAKYSAAAVVAFKNWIETRFGDAEPWGRR